MDTSPTIRASLHKQIAADRWVSTQLRKNRFRRLRLYELGDGLQAFTSSHTLSVFQLSRNKSKRRPKISRERRQDLLPSKRRSQQHWLTMTCCVELATEGEMMQVTARTHHHLVVNTTTSTATFTSMHQSYAGTIKSTQVRTSHRSSGLLVIPAPKAFLALLPIQPVVPSLLLDFVVPSFPDLLRLLIQSGLHCSLHH
jgi:hypothetical protein